MSVEVAQLRCFVVVAEELHFTRAADRLGIPQPAVSEQIRVLERRLRASLFLRTTRRVQLTAAGEDLLGRARAAVAAVDAVGVLAATRRDGRPARHTVAVETLHPGLGAMMRDALPGTSAVIRVGDPTELLDVVARGEVDAWLGAPFLGAA
ncbi:MAG: LysR family transcriptional regulator, partial [Phycicoccus sp.]